MCKTGTEYSKRGEVHNGIIGPGGYSTGGYYVCHHCTVHFSNPEKFNIEPPEEPIIRDFTEPLKKKQNRTAKHVAAAISGFLPDNEISLSATCRFIISGFDLVQSIKVKLGYNDKPWTDEEVEQHRWESLASGIAETLPADETKWNDWQKKIAKVWFE